MPGPATLASAISASSPSAPDSEAPAFSPLYKQIKALMTRGLQQGEWHPGELIPSELELAARFKVSQGTVRKAVDELAAENLLVRRQGKGTFVATHAEETIQFRFLRLTPDDSVPGQRAAMQRLERKFIDCVRHRPSAELVKQLKLRPNDAVVRIRRVLSFRGTPVVLDDIWLPAPLFKGLTAERLSDYRGPMYGLFETEFGVRMIRAEEKIRAVAADRTSADLLAIDAGSPLLSVERLSMTYDDKPVEWRRGLYNTATHYYRNELS